MKNNDNKKVKKYYKKPKLRNLGSMVQVTLPGGSVNTEGASGKGHNQ